VVVRSVAPILLLALWPLSNFANHNREQLSAGDYVFLGQIYLLILLAAGLLWGLLQLATRARRPIAVTSAVSLLVILFFNFEVIRDAFVPVATALGIEGDSFYAYCVLTIAISAACLRWANHEAVLLLLTVFGVTASAIPGLSLSAFLLRAPDEVVSLPYSSIEVSIPADRRPNIYYFILDGYARKEILGRVVGLDNAPFEQELRERGFFVAEDAYSNYPLSFMSISTGLAMNYIATEEGEPFTSRESSTRRSRETIRSSSNFAAMDTPTRTWGRSSGRAPGAAAVRIYV
jgi:hypothetical protein